MRMLHFFGHIFFFQRPEKKVVFLDEGETAPVLFGQSDSF